MSFWLLLTASLAAASSMMAGDAGVRARFVGGTIQGVARQSGVTLDLTAPDVLTFRSRESRLHIPYARINTLEYGQNVSRRYAAAILISPVLLLSKSRKHFLT